MIEFANETKEIITLGQIELMDSIMRERLRLAEEIKSPQIYYTRTEARDAFRETLGLAEKREPQEEIKKLTLNLKSLLARLADELKKETVGQSQRWKNHLRPHLFVDHDNYGIFFCTALSSWRKHFGGSGPTGMPFPGEIIDRLRELVGGKLEFQVETRVVDYEISQVQVAALVFIRNLPDTEQSQTREGMSLV
jgi:hypothetical protein